MLPEEYGRKVTRSGDWAETLEAYRERTRDLPKKTPAGRTVATCPATFLDTSCKDCGLCQHIKNRAIVGFPAHGTDKAKADAIARAA